MKKFNLNHNTEGLLFSKPKILLEVTKGAPNSIEKYVKLRILLLSSDQQNWKLLVRSGSAYYSAHSYYYRSKFSIGFGAPYLTSKTIIGFKKTKCKIANFSYRNITFSGHLQGFLNEEIQLQPTFFPILRKNFSLRGYWVIRLYFLFFHL